MFEGGFTAAGMLETGPRGTTEEGTVEEGVTDGRLDGIAGGTTGG
jgi:hypothetical protein